MNNYNVKILSESKANTKLLLDTNAYIELEKVAKSTGVDTLYELSKWYGHVEYFITQSVFEELCRIKGSQIEIPNIYYDNVRRILEDDVVGDYIKHNEFLYTDKKGSIKSVKMNNISLTDYGCILLCQNNENLILVTNDHKMLKSANALINGRLMDVPTLFSHLATDQALNTVENKSLINTREELKGKWKIVKDWYESKGGYNPPKNVHLPMPNIE